MKRDGCKGRSPESLHRLGSVTRIHFMAESELAGSYLVVALGSRRLPAQPIDADGSGVGAHPILTYPGQETLRRNTELGLDAGRVTNLGEPV